MPWRITFFLAQLGILQRYGLSSYSLLCASGRWPIGGAWQGTLRAPSRVIFLFSTKKATTRSYVASEESRFSVEQESTTDRVVWCECNNNISIFHTTNEESAAAYLGKLTGKRIFFVPARCPHQTTPFFSCHFFFQDAKITPRFTASAKIYHAILLHFDLISHRIFHANAKYFPVTV